MKTDDEIYKEMYEREYAAATVPFPNGEFREGVSGIFENSERPADEWLDCDCDFSDSRAINVVLASRD